MKRYSNKRNEDYKDTYQKITDYVIEQLEKGEIIWRKGWNRLGLPKNIITGHCYKGWNVFLLNFVTMFHSYKTPYFITYKQALEAGGSVRRGQKGYPVVWWATVEDRNKSVETNDDADEEINRNTYKVPKTHTVFNIDQTHGITFSHVGGMFRNNAGTIETCEDVIHNMPTPPAIIHTGDKACYIRILDEIKMPSAGLFHTDKAYYATLFHELAHSTGHEKRLNRKELIEHDGFGGENYSKEELTAELAAAYLCAVCGIEQQTVTNSAAYLQQWLEALQNDKRLILKAASQAQAAADYILNLSYSKEEISTITEPAMA